jgi:hypothetical protein
MSVLVLFLALPQIAAGEEYFLKSGDTVSAVVFKVTRNAAYYRGPGVKVFDKHGRELPKSQYDWVYPDWKVTINDELVRTKVAVGTKGKTLEQVCAGKAILALCVEFVAKINSLNSQRANVPLKEDVRVHDGFGNAWANPALNAAVASQPNEKFDASTPASQSTQASTGGNGTSERSAIRTADGLPVTPEQTNAEVQKVGETLAVSPRPNSIRSPMLVLAVGAAAAVGFAVTCAVVRRRTKRLADEFFEDFRRTIHHEGCINSENLRIWHSPLSRRFKVFIPQRSAGYPNLDNFKIPFERDLIECLRKLGEQPFERHGELEECAGIHINNLPDGYTDNGKWIVIRFKYTGRKPVTDYAIEGVKSARIIT